MIGQFKEWITDIQNTALSEKRKKAEEKGDVSKWKKEIWKSPEKNKAIKARFLKEGRLRGYRPRPSDNSGEWLYDFVWREFDAENNLVRVVLTMEIEVSGMTESAIKYDFQKLLQADSEYKILVFQLKTEAEIQNALNNFRRCAQIYQVRVDARYLLCGWCIAKNEFIFEDFHMTANA
ncbi:MAG: hypothetical protein WAW36_04565 [Methylovulum miyakonense]|uniref:hypothetical protein n=1 Tax=Methylovulum miyakonense TaxID=645578 RepID=UPI003BB7BC22